MVYSCKPISVYSYKPALSRILERSIQDWNKQFFRGHAMLEPDYNTGPFFESNNYIKTPFYIIAGYFQTPCITVLPAI